MTSIKLEGIWKIVDTTPEKNAHRLDRYVVFPFNIKVGGIAKWFYVNYKEQDVKAGSMTVTSIIRDIDFRDPNAIYIETSNSEYVLEKVA